MKEVLVRRVWLALHLVSRPQVRSCAMLAPPLTAAIVLFVQQRLGKTSNKRTFRKRAEGTDKSILAIFAYMWDTGYIRRSTIAWETAHNRTRQTCAGRVQRSSRAVCRLEGDSWPVDGHAQLAWPQQPGSLVE